MFLLKRVSELWADGEKEQGMPGCFYDRYKGQWRCLYVAMRCIAFCIIVSDCAVLA